MDNNLPDGFGWDKIPTLIPEYPNMNVVLMSAYRKEGSDFSYKNDNCSFIEKPLNAEKLAQITRFLV
jgi:DNA-binding NtrC family response regulator